MREAVVRESAIRVDPRDGDPIQGGTIPLDGRWYPGLGELLEARWTQDVERGLVMYDVRDVRTAQVEPYRFHFIPGRSSRPGSWNPPAVPPEGVFVAHQPCPFDDEEFAPEREFARLIRDGREYQLVSNRFPVTAPHFLGVRPKEDDNEEKLRQHLYGTEEIEDLILFSMMLGPGYRVFFNSNRGADGSSGGSSINHWHFQFFTNEPDRPPPLRDLEMLVERDLGDTRRGTLSDWAARNVAVDLVNGAVPAAAGLVWEVIEEIHLENAAYNVEMIPRGGDAARVVVYPRAPSGVTRIGDVGELDTNFGGWELSGDFVIPDVAILEWFENNAEVGREISRQRLEATTRRVHYGRPDASGGE